MRIVVVSSRKGGLCLLGDIYSNCFRQAGHEVMDFYDVAEMESFLPRFSFLRNLNWWRMQRKNVYGPLQSIPVRILKKIFMKAENRANRSLLDLCSSFRPHLVFVVVGRAIAPETVEKIRNDFNSFCCVYNGDDYDNPYSTSTNMLESLPYYDVVFVWSNRMKESASRLGAKRTVLLPFGFLPNQHKKANLSREEEKKYGHDIVFIGTWDRKRERFLSRLKDLDLAIWGPRWNMIRASSGLQDKIMGTDPVDYPTMSKIYCSSKISLNILRDQNDNSHNMKTFEIPAMGGFMLTAQTPDHLELFSDTAGYFTGPEDVKEKALLFIEEDDLREKMRRQAFLKISRDHSYINRAAEVLEIVRERSHAE